MRAACDLPLRTAAAASGNGGDGADTFAHLAVTDSQDADIRKQQSVVKYATSFYCRELLKRAMNFLTQQTFNVIGLPPGVTLSRAELWKAITDSSLWMEAGPDRKSKSRYLPNIQMRGGLDSLYSTPAADKTAQTFPEVYDTHEFGRVFGEGTGDIRHMNTEVLRHSLMFARTDARPKRAGRLSSEAQRIDEEWSSRIAKLDSCESNILACNRFCSSMRPEPPSPRKRQRIKGSLSQQSSDPAGPAPVDSGSRGSSARVCNTVAYAYTRGWRTRRQVQGTGAQVMPQCIQRPLLPHTADCDMKNYVFSVLPQIARRPFSFARAYACACVVNPCVCSIMLVFPSQNH